MATTSPREVLQKAIAKAAETRISAMLDKDPGIAINLDAFRSHREPLIAGASHLALATDSQRAERNLGGHPSNPAGAEVAGSKLQVSKNVTIQALGPSYIEGQKRYQEMVIVDGGDPKLRGKPILVRVLGEMDNSSELVGTLTKGADGEYWFTPQKKGSPTYYDPTPERSGN